MDPGIQEISPGKMCGGQQPKPSLAHPDARKAPAETQQKWRKHALIVLPTHSRHDNSRVSNVMINESVSVISSGITLQYTHVILL